MGGFPHRVIVRIGCSNGLSLIEACPIDSWHLGTFLSTVLKGDNNESHIGGAY